MLVEFLRSSVVIILLRNHALVSTRTVSCNRSRPLGVQPNRFRRGDFLWYNSNNFIDEYDRDARIPKTHSSTVLIDWFFFSFTLCQYFERSVCAIRTVFLMESIPFHMNYCKNWFHSLFFFSQNEWEFVFLIFVIGTLTLYFLGR